MAYEKINWVDKVTACSAANFNHMEDGIYNLAQALNFKVKFGDVLITPTTDISDSTIFTKRGTATINIGLDWGSTPLVYVTVRSGSPHICAVSSENYNAVTGEVVITLDRSSSTATGINWIAIGS